MALQGQYIEEKTINCRAFFWVRPPKISEDSDRAEIVETMLSLEAMPAMREAHIFSFPRPMGESNFEGKYAINSSALTLVPAILIFIIPRDHTSILDSTVIIPARFRNSQIREPASNIIFLNDGRVRETALRICVQQRVFFENIRAYKIKKRNVNR